MGRAHCRVLFLHYRLIIEIKAEAREIKKWRRQKSHYTGIEIGLGIHTTVFSGWGSSVSH